MEQQEFLFDSRFLEKYAGQKILNDPITAIIELIANSWDAGATKVNIQWPDESNNYEFFISDNGSGISKDDFNNIWSTWYYNRQKNKGKYADSVNQIDKRIAFGKNGVGRFAGFCFSESYYVETAKDGFKSQFQISRALDKPFEIKLNSSESCNTNGTKIICKEVDPINLPDLEDIKSEISMRFISNPDFLIFVNNQKLSIKDIYSGNIKSEKINIESVGEITIHTIDTHECDKSTKHHGIAWRVNERLVGDITWNYLSKDFNIDGRRIESKRYTFIINANTLDSYVLHDWSAFDSSFQVVKDVEARVYKYIWNEIVSSNSKKRNDFLNKLNKSFNKNLKKLSPIKREKWEAFVIDIQKQCPSLTDKELTLISEILMKLELSTNKYDLLNSLNKLDSNDMDNLNTILNEWSVEYAKIVLDEIQSRMKLLNELDNKLYSIKADELHELQPLFHRGLWIFGPEYETIEFTSNKGMTNVIQNLFKCNIKGSKNRPDFAISTDSTVGLYSYPNYDDEGAEVSIGKLTIVELKAPGVPLNKDEIEQPWKYVKELYSKGILAEQLTPITCFVVGESIAPFEGGKRTMNNEKVVIIPITYDTVIQRAKSRLHKLYDKVKDSPFFEEINEYYKQDLEDNKELILQF